MDVVNRKIAVPLMALVVVLGGVVPAMGADIVVTDYDELKNAIQNVAEPGDVILVQPGTYYANEERLKIYDVGTGDPITIRGVLDEQDNMPVFTPATGIEINRGHPVLLAGGP
jgi:hypothetical protein